MTGPDQCFCFQILIEYVLDIFIQKTFFSIMKVNIFRGDLNNIPAKNEVLGPTASAASTGR